MFSIHPHNRYMVIFHPLEYLWFDLIKYRSKFAITQKSDFSLVLQFPFVVSWFDSQPDSQVTIWSNSHNITEKMESTRDRFHSIFKRHTILTNLQQ
jgi:hypothetical protein